jgi:molybdopterin-binding protein
MKVSARNTIKGTVKSVTLGAVNTEVVVEVAPGVEIVSVITKASSEALGLMEGKEVFTVIKSSDVMIAVEG